MNKWISLVVAAGVAGAAAFVALKPADESGFQSKASISEAKVSSKEMLSYVPADTVYYFGGNSSKAMATFMHDYKIFGAMPSELVMWQGVLHSMAEDNESKGARFLEVLLKGVIDNTEGTMGDVTEYFGTASVGPYALYSHGVIPVLRMPVNDAALFYSRLEEATALSKVSTSEKTWGDLKVKLWDLKEASDTPAIQLAVTEQDHMLVITLVSPKDEEAAIKARFGLSKPKQSLASSGEIEKLQKEYRYTDDMVYLVNFHRLAEGILSPESNSFGKNLLQYMSAEEAAEMTADLTPECKADYLGMVANVPRLVGGYRDLSIKGERLMMDFQALLEIKNPNVIEQLQAIRGHVPEHAMESSDKLFAFGLGLSVDNAVPAMTALWNEFISAKFTCEKLVQAQIDARQANPAIAGMFLGMVNGLKGIGMSLYDIEMDTQTMMPKSVSALISAASENPQTLVSMAAMVPMLQGLNIPADGSEVDVNLPMVPPNIKVKAAIKGKHLVVYAGDKAAAQVAKLGSDKIPSNGLMSFAADYRQFATVMDELMALEKLETGGAADAGEFGCASRDMLQETFSTMQMDFSLKADITDKGSVWEGTGSMDKSSWRSPVVAGKFNVAKLNQACEWTTVGSDTRKDDGTGSIALKDVNGQCELYKATYSWKKQGMRLVMQDIKGEQRDACDASWSEISVKEQSCYLYASTGAEYKCASGEQMEMMNEMDVSRFSQK